MQCSQYVNRTVELYRVFLEGITDPKEGYQKLLEGGFIDDIPYDEKWEHICDLLDAVIKLSPEEEANCFDVGSYFEPLQVISLIFLCLS
jgi:hypothetical protein